MPVDSTKKTFAVAAAVALVCSILVSGAAVFLKIHQDRNRELEKNKNILLAAGLYEKDKKIDELFKNITTRVIDLKQGTYMDDVDPETIDPRRAVKYRQTRMKAPEDDREAKIARIKYVPKTTLVYELRSNDRLTMIILPVTGSGLWSEMFGFIALDADAQTIKGITFYEHGETPGLGGEVDNETWKAQWKGKLAFDKEWNVAIRVIKGKVDTNRKDSVYKVDGLSGATLTTNGVSALVRFWLGKNGYGPFLEKIRKGDAS